MNLPLVSIVIPVYKVEKYLEKSVLSIINQTYQNKEIILVDDGSPDSCPMICDTLAADNPSISVIHKENGGLSSARNAGIESASGEYILFLDSDDTLAQDAIEDMVNIALTEESDFVLPNTYYKVFENSGEEKLCYNFSESMFTPDPKEFALEALIRAGRARRTTAVLYKTELIKKNNIRFPLGRVSEDFFFSLDAYSYANKISLYVKPSLYYLKRAGSISTSFFSGFYNTIMEMDTCVRIFTERLDKDRYKSNIYAARESLLCRNIIIYAINVMGSTDKPYKERKKICVEMFEEATFRQALKSKCTPFFTGGLRKAYMKLSLYLVKIRWYTVACRLARLAAKINAV